MPRIPDEQIQRLKKEVSLERLCGRYNIDIEGRPVQMYGRKVTAKLRKGTPDHLYLEGPLKGIWNVEGIMHQKSWILCEAIIDALTLWTHGVRNVTT